MKRPAPPSRTLMGLAEVHDLSYAYQAAPLLQLLEDEADLLPDLLHARPWLAGLERVGAVRVLETLLEQEWSGFLARLGRLGPWVFAPTVAGLQALSGAYSAVVLAASGSSLEKQPASTLLGRLANGGGLTEPTAPERRPSGQAEDAERAFWALAQAKAEEQRTDWASRTRR
jgi:hypothetical protein